MDTAKVDIRKHITGNPVTISWENEPYFMGAFKANLPGHYRYQRRLYTHFMQERLPEDKRGIFLAGDDISWTAGWARGWRPCRTGSCSWPRASRRGARRPSTEAKAG